MKMKEERSFQWTKMDRGSIWSFSSLEHCVISDIHSRPFILFSRIEELRFRLEPLAELKDH